jgi:hypothetical protein
MRGRTVAYIFETIKNLERELAFVKALVQQTISEEEIGQDGILVNAKYFEETEQEILVNAEIIEDTKSQAKPTKKEQRLEAHQRAQMWAELLPNNKEKGESDATKDRGSSVLRALDGLPRMVLTREERKTALAHIIKNVFMLADDNP